MEATGTRIVRELPLGQPARLHFRGDHISVSILPAPDGVQGRMTVELPDAEDTVDVDVSERGGVVFVTVEQRDRLHRVLRARWKDRWGVVCRLELPSGVEAMIETAAGKIEARSLSGTFDLRTDAGQVVLAYLSGRLRVQTNAGKIDCTGFRGGIEATTNAGQIRLEAEALDAGVHHLRADVGRIDVRLPREAPIRVETRTSLGRARNEFGAGRQDAAALLRIQTEVGAIFVQAAEAEAAPAGNLHGGLNEEERHTATMRVLQRVADHELSAEDANHRIADINRGLRPEE